ncbi:MAG: hypothetical protein ACM3NT_06670 [Methylocystaceae bacterium]
MYSFTERKLLDDVVTAIFKLKARDRLNDAESAQLLVLTRMAESGEQPSLFNALRQALVKPGIGQEDTEIRALIVQTLLSSDLYNQEDVKLLENVINELLEGASS